MKETEGVPRVDSGEQAKLRTAPYVRGWLLAIKGQLGQRKFACHCSWAC